LGEHHSEAGALGNVHLDGHTMLGVEGGKAAPSTAACTERWKGRYEKVGKKEG
jgi:hypothetical protein